MQRPLGQAENEAYDKIKLVQTGDGVTAYGVLFRWLIDVSGPGLVEQSRMLRNPSPPKKKEEEEEELAEYVEMWQDK